MYPVYRQTVKNPTGLLAHAMSASNAKFAAFLSPVFFTFTFFFGVAVAWPRSRWKAHTFVWGQP